MPLNIDITQYDLYQEGFSAGFAEVYSKICPKIDEESDEEFKLRMITALIRMGKVRPGVISSVFDFPLEKLVEIRDQLAK